MIVYKKIYIFYISTYKYDEYQTKIVSNGSNFLLNHEMMDFFFFSNWVLKRHQLELTVRQNTVPCHEEMVQYICGFQIKNIVRRYGTMLLDTLLLQVHFTLYWPDWNLLTCCIIFGMFSYLKMSRILTLWGEICLLELLWDVHNWLWRNWFKLHIWKHGD